jgi:hypothetical protein
VSETPPRARGDQGHTLNFDGGISAAAAVSLNAGAMRKGVNVAVR